MEQEASSFDFLFVMAFMRHSAILSSKVVKGNLYPIMDEVLEVRMAYIKIKGRWP